VAVGALAPRPRAPTGGRDRTDRRATARNESENATNAPPRRPI